MDSRRLKMRKVALYFRVAKAMDSVFLRIYILIWWFFNNWFLIGKYESHLACPAQLPPTQERPQDPCGHLLSSLSPKASQMQKWIAKSCFPNLGRDGVQSERAKNGDDRAPMDLPYWAPLVPQGCMAFSGEAFKVWESCQQKVRVPGGLVQK